MPRIKAYVNGKSMIAVDSATVKTVFRCPFTQNLFPTKNSYSKHLMEYRKFIHRRISENNHKRMLSDLHSQTSFENIIKWIEKHPAFFYYNGLRYGSSPKCIMPNNFSIKITYLNLIWSDSVSNTHDCPHNGVTNWGGREKFNDGTPKPRGYPGFDGRIEYKLSHDRSGFFSMDILDNTGIHTGTGGGISGNRYGFSVKFFEADWPGLTEYVTMEKLKGNTDFHHINIGKPVYFK